jgi:predicted transcriptional regulator of viral defense system
MPGHGGCILNCCDETYTVDIISRGIVTMLPTQKERALGLLGASGMLRLKDFIAEGIEPETLARLVREQRVIRPARGLYQLPDAPIDAAHMLLEASVLVPKGIICLISALQFHTLTLQMPSAVWMAIERTAWKPTISYPPIRFVRFSGASLTDGVERHTVLSREILVTNPARTIVDCFRYRNKIGIDVAMEGLREGIRHRKCTADQLWHYAKEARVWTVMRPYVEAVVADAA